MSANNGVTWGDHKREVLVTDERTFQIDKGNILSKKVVRKSKTKKDKKTEERIMMSDNSHDWRKSQPLSHMFKREKRKTYKSVKKFPTPEKDYQYHYQTTIETYQELHVQLVKLINLKSQTEQIELAKSLLKTNVTFTTFVNKMFLRGALLAPCLDGYMKQVVIKLKGSEGQEDLKLLQERIKYAIERVALRKQVYIKHLKLFEEFDRMAELRHCMPVELLTQKAEQLKGESAVFQKVFEEKEKHLISYLRGSRYRKFLTTYWKENLKELFHDN